MMVNDILEHQQQDILISEKKSAQETEQQHTLRKSLLDVKNARAQQEEHVLLNMIPQRKGRSKEIDQEAQFNYTTLQKGNAPERTGKVHLEKKISYRVSTTEEEIVVMIENVIAGVPRHFKKDKCQMGKDCPFIHPQKKKRSTSPPQKDR